MRSQLAVAVSVALAATPDVAVFAHSVPADPAAPQAPVEAPAPGSGTPHVSIVVPGAPPQVQTVVNRFKLWRTGTTLPACFINGDRDLRAFFVQTARTWLERGGLAIDFGAAPAFRDCRGPDDKAFRIAFGYQKAGGVWDSGNWSYVGVDANTAPAGPTINIGYAANTTLSRLDRYELRRLVLHEVGHALGLEHEHQSPLARCEFDWAKVVPYYQSQYGWDEQMTKFNLGRLTPVRGLEASPYDPDSVMNYGFPAWVFVQTAGQPTCEVRESYEPSRTDLANYALLYPGGQPAPASAGAPTTPNEQQVRQAQQQQDQQLAARAARALEALQLLLPNEDQRRQAADLLGATAQGQFPNFRVNVQDRSVRVGGNQAIAREVRGGNLVAGNQAVGANQIIIDGVVVNTAAPCSPVSIGVGGNVSNNINCATNTINGTQNNVQGNQINNHNNVQGFQMNNSGTFNNQGGINLNTPSR